MKLCPFISIITPTLNSEARIEACLKSVANQTYKTVEHLFVDGLSTDRTIEIVKKYQTLFNHIRLISEKDCGIYDAINKGIGVAAGEWVYILGSDDELFDRNVLERIIKSGYLSGKASFVYGNVLVENKISWAGKGEVYDGRFNTRKLVKRNICQQAVFYRKELFFRYGLFDLRYPVCSDWEKNLQLFRNVKTKYIPEIIARFEGGVSGSQGVTDPFLDEIGAFRKLYTPVRFYYLKIRDMLSGFSDSFKRDHEKGE
jgi:glycosyltransferase involved in cell wall biosynthesis